MLSPGPVTFEVFVAIVEAFVIDDVFVILLDCWIYGKHEMLQKYCNDTILKFRIKKLLLLGTIC